MSRPSMHADQVGTDRSLVRRLLAAQLPQWADLPVRPVDSFGTDHDIYRLGEHLVVRMPRMAWAVDQVAIEGTWLPRIAPHVRLTVPVQRAVGVPAYGYPYPWSVYEWLPGESASTAALDLDRAAVDLAGFIRGLRTVDTTGAHLRVQGHRGSPLRDLDLGVRESVDRLGKRVDRSAALASWEASLAAAPWDGPPTWLHGDLLPGNLLVRNDRLSAVIDFGGLNVGDPACDLQPAWNMFSGSSRARFRHEMDADDNAWQRGRGWTLSQTVSALPYYWDTNPGIVAQALRALRELLAGTA